jgi:hypothetical protein
MPLDRVAALGSQIVGVVILITAGIKAGSPTKFRNHLAGLRMFSARWLDTAVAAIAGAEGAWGFALLIGLWPRLLLPVSVGLLGALSAVTVWSVRTGRAEDCGCYGGFVRPSIGQSLALNGLYAALLVAAMIARQKMDLASEWGAPAVLSVGVLFALAAEVVRRSKSASHEGSRNPSPLKAGTPWTSEWSAGSSVGSESEHIVSYLGPRCPYCRTWVGILNLTHESPTLPDVTGVLAASDREVEEFVRTTGVRFPVVTIPQTLMSTLTATVPTTVSIESGVITDVWAGNGSPAFFARFKESFFTSAGAPDRILQDAGQT